MKKWREFFKPIVQQSDGKPITFRHSLNENRSIRWLLTIFKCDFQVYGNLNLHEWHGWCGYAVDDLRREPLFPFKPHVCIFQKKNLSQYVNCVYKLRMFSFWTIRIRTYNPYHSNLRDPTDETMNLWTSRMIRSLNAPWSEWSWIVNSDLDHPKGTHLFNTRLGSI